MAKKISKERKVIYYVGLFLMIIGMLSFFSVFITFFIDSPFSNRFYGFHDSNYPGNFFGTTPLRAFIGIILIIIGNFLMRVGRSGLAGSGLVLDPEKAREDLEPWNRTKGGMINDTLDEIEVVKDIATNLKNTAEDKKTIVKIRCRSCGELNDEDAKFCKECGTPL